MTKCPPSTCFTCRLAGLHECPFNPRARLPLVDAEQKKRLLYQDGTGVTFSEALRMCRKYINRRTD